MVNFRPLAAEIGPVVWGTPPNFNGFRVLAALLHDTPAVGISQTLRRSTEGATYSSGRPRHWASAHSLVFINLYEVTQFMYYYNDIVCTFILVV